MEIGGKQGSRLTGRMFGKMMDLLSEEAETTEGFHITNELIIAFLLWVDDVVSCVEGTKNQETILNKINEFAIKHKISWGQEKCNIMRVGKHTEKMNTWKPAELLCQTQTVSLCIVRATFIERSFGD